MSTKISISFPIQNIRGCGYLGAIEFLKSQCLQIGRPKWQANQRRCSADLGKSRRERNRPIRADRHR
jgi:hypothetical protein